MFFSLRSVDDANDYTKLPQGGVIAFRAQKYVCIAKKYALSGVADWRSGCSDTPTQPKRRSAVRPTRV
ncbi:MAG: hypothetical protein ILM98_00145 [Kiritimatiellae bacterium]|nr:hypothetical protein [Kiritimatiellia bacterium]